MSNDKLAAGPDERAAFEAWAARSGCHTKRSDKDRERYHAWLTNALWNGWQGRAACAALAEHEAQLPNGLDLAVIGHRHFGNPIPREWYAAAKELLAAPQPQAREPLTEDQARLLFLNLSEKMTDEETMDSPFAMFLEILRDCERAHGIGTEGGQG